MLVGCAEALDGAAGAAVASGDACGVAAGSSEAVCITEREPVTAGKDNIRAASMKSAAAPIVILASRVCVPRGPKAVLETLLEKSAPASALPGCNSTAMTSTRHDRMNNPYNE